MGVAVGEGLTAQDTPHQAGEPAPPRPRSTLTHPAGRYFDHELGCLVSRGLGSSWRCTCGERGPIYRSEAEARAGKREHEAEHTISAITHREARSGSTEPGHRRHAHRGDGEAGQAARDGEGRAEA